MNITTRFNVNDLVQSKFQLPGSMDFMEVIEISSVTCSAGTQNYYIVRAYKPKYKFRFTTKEGIMGEENQVERFDMASRGEHVEYAKIREDELMPAAKEVGDKLKELNIAL